MNAAPAAARSAAAPTPLAPIAPIAWPLAIGVALILFAGLLVHAWTFGSVVGGERHLFLSDDALISLRYARRLLDGHGLTWNDGERVEGYSNLLWVLAVAALGKLGLDLVVAVRLLGVVASCATVAALLFAFPPRRRVAASSPPAWRTALPALIGGAGLVLAAPFACWVVGGLEQPLLVALVAWAAVLLAPSFDGEPSSRSLWIASLLLAGAVLTRPDGALFPAIACAALLLVRRFDRTSFVAAAKLASLPLLAQIGQLAFRLAYYGEWIANSARAKLGFSSSRVGIGVVYVSRGLNALLPLLVLAALALVAAWRSGRGRGRTALLASLLVGWTLYQVAVGPDYCPAYRHLAVVALLAALLAADGVRWTSTLVRARVVVPSAAGLLALLGWLQTNESENERAREEKLEWEAPVVGAMLKSAFGEQRPLLAVDAAGCLPYYSGLPALDMLGLNDRWLATHPPANFGHGMVGHELGDGRYVLSRRPDLVVFGTARGGLPGFKSGVEMLVEPSFLRDYQSVVFECDTPFHCASTIWVRREGSPIGVQRSARRVVVPAFLLVPPGARRVPIGPDRTEPSVPVGKATLASDGRFEAKVGTKRSSLLQFPLDAGRWSVTTEPRANGVRLSVRSGAAEPTAAGDAACTFVLPRDAKPVDVDVVATDPPEARLRALVFERADE